MANRWENNGNSDRLYFGGSKMTADGDDNHEITILLLLGRKAMTNLSSIFKKQRHYFANKAMVFPVVMHGCESWTIKKAECQRIDAFELWCWTKLLESLGLQGDPTGPS